ESLTRVKTLSGILDRLVSDEVVPVSPASLPAAASAAVPVGQDVDRAALTRLLVQQISERTGYPPEMLGLDQDIEAEPGIDPLNRVEVLGALQERLPAAMVARVSGQMETLTRVKTLNGIVDRLLVAGTSETAAVMGVGGVATSPLSAPPMAEQARIE